MKNKKFVKETKDSRKKKPQNQKNQRNSSKRDRNPADSDTAMGIPETNDFAWYNQYPDLVEAVARIPFAKRPGMGIGLNSIDLFEYNDPFDKHDLITMTPETEYVIPTVMSLHWIPTIGKSVDNQSPASIAARELYAKVRSAFSGTLDENGPDILMYIVALDSVFAYLAWMKRVYRALASFSPNNKGVPLAILRAEGFSETQINSLMQNRTRMWGIINQLIYNVSKFTCPDVMALFKRHYWMSSNVYTDSTEKMAQLYLFVPDGFYKFNDHGPTGTQLDYVANTVSGSDPLDSMWNKCNDLIAALSGSDDAYTINGRLARAFDGTASFTVAPLLEHEVLDFVYDPVVLMQINNAHTPISASISEVASITQDPLTNAVLQTISDPLIEQSSYYALNRAVLNIPSDNPGVGDVVEATRLTTLVDTDGTFDCGTELISRIYMIENEVDSPFTGVIIPNLDTVTGSMSLPFSVTHLASYMAFKSAPILYIVKEGQEGVDSVLPLTDLRNATVITRDTLKDLHEICVYSEFNSFGIR